MGAAGGSVVSRFGWLSELLTELTMQYHSPTETEKVGYISKIGFNLNRIFGPIWAPTGHGRPPRDRLAMQSTPKGSLLGVPS